MAAVRRANVSYREKDRVRIAVDAVIVAEPGRFTPHELANLKSSLAEKLMIAMTDLPYVHIKLSELKVTR